MAHTALHLSAGLAAGTFLPIPSLIKRLTGRRRKSGPLGVWLLAAYALAFFASVPNVLRSLGVPESVCSGRWMNIFLFHPLIDAAKDGGMLIGELLLAACFSVQYAVLLMALHAVKQRTSNHDLDQLPESS